MDDFSILSEKDASGGGHLVSVFSEVSFKLNYQPPPHDARDNLLPRDGQGLFLGEAAPSSSLRTKTHASPRTYEGLGVISQSHD